VIASARRSTVLEKGERAIGSGWRVADSRGGSGPSRLRDAHPDKLAPRTRRAFPKYFDSVPHPVSYWPKEVRRFG